MIPTGVDTFVYFLDDDNLVHPDLWRILPLIDKRHIYSFDTIRGDGNVMKGDNPSVNNIDSSQVLIHSSLIHSLRWEPHLYNADGVFIENVVYLNPHKWVYFADTLAYYNKLT